MLTWLLPILHSASMGAAVPFCAVLLCVALGGFVGPGPVVPFARLVVREPAAPFIHRPAGRIEGHISVRERPARRMPSRYPGTAGGPSRPVQRIPAVVYIEGRFAGPTAPVQVEMAQQDSAFTPAVLVVPVHSEVRFPNRDHFFHNVFSYSSAQRFDLGRYPRGESKTVKFDEPGIIKVYCEVHESMRAAIVVAENPYHAVLGADGSFSLEGVPPGMHRLVVWQVDLGSSTHEVRVTDGGTARVDLTIG